MSGGPVPLVGFCAYSGTGKTTLLKRLIPLLKAQGVRVGVIKHAHHLFEIDREGKDTYELRKAGANQTLIASRRRTAWIEEFEGSHDEPVLEEVLPSMKCGSLDLILVEGFKHGDFPKIELHRKALGKPLMFPGHPNIVAVATDYPLLRPARPLPCLDLHDVEQIANFVLDFAALRETAGGTRP